MLHCIRCGIYHRVRLVEFCDVFGIQHKEYLCTSCRHKVKRRLKVVTIGNIELYDNDKEFIRGVWNVRNL